MKLIYKSQETWELLHNWKTNSLEVKAGFFFHHRGSALQKSFEGVLRSLVIQILAPYHKIYLEKHGHIWNTYQDLKRTQENVERERERARARLGSNLKAIPTEITQGREDVICQPVPPDEAPHGPQTAAYTGGDPERLEKLPNRQAKITKQLAKAERNWAAKLSSIRTSITSLAAELGHLNKDPLARLLTQVVAGFHEERDGLIPRLERALSRLLDQDARKTDLVLFFDALDEFDGHLDLISRFLKGMVTSSQSSMTSVKICFSSRPWEPLKEQFSTFPGFSLQDYTREDMEQFAASSVAQASITNPLVTRLVPSIIIRANGVFLWIKLALKILLETAVTTPVASLPEVLKTKLRELPDDLFEFYTLIISRISRNNRRRTFALLELLARRGNSQITCIHLWNAVMVASCDTYRAAKAYDPSDNSQRARRDIAAWGGGLVEVKRQGDVELMHQTVLEFVTSLECNMKQIVLGDLASLIHENGHGFHLKYFSLRLVAALIPKSFQALIESRKPTHGGIARYDTTVLTNNAVLQFAYHAEQSELTTGASHFDFLYDMCSAIFLIHPEFIRGKNETLLLIAASCGLTLCLRDMFAKFKMSEVNTRFRQGLPSLPLQGLVFRPSHEPFAERHLEAIRLLLEKGYMVNKEPEFLHWLFREDWGSRLHRSEKLMPDSTLLELAELVLCNGADANIVLPIYDDVGTPNRHARPLHIAPAPLASMLLRYGANPKLADNLRSRPTPLDWLVQLDAYGLRRLENWSTAERYERCRILIGAGGTLSTLTSQDAWKMMMDEFERKGYNTESFWEAYPALRGVTLVVRPPASARQESLHKDQERFPRQRQPQLAHNDAHCDELKPRRSKARWLCCGGE